MFSPLVQTRGVQLGGHGGQMAAVSPGAAYRAPSAKVEGHVQVAGQARSPMVGQGMGYSAQQLPPPNQVPGTPVTEHRLAKGRRSAPPLAPPVAAMRTPSVDHRQVYVVEQGSGASAPPPTATQQLVTTTAQQSPRGEHRWLSHTPQVECRASPMVQYRAVGSSVVATVPPTAATAMAPTPVTAALVLPSPSAGRVPSFEQSLNSPQSPLATSRVLPVVVQPSNLTATSRSTPTVPSWAVMTPTMRQVSARVHTGFGKHLVPVSVVNRGHGHGTPAFPRVVPDHGLASALLSSDEALQNTVSMLPPSPGNSLLQFLHDVSNGDVEPASCNMDPRIDAQRYWEMRRVQNSLRRVLEGLEELLGLEVGASPTTISSALWEHFFPEFRCVDEQAFVAALERSGMWPPEMSAADRTEVFAALRVPSAAAVRALTAGQPPTMQLSRRMVCEGFARLPFNIPDFPVPASLYDPALVGLGVDQVAKLVAAAFSREVFGLEKTKDYYLTGLLSLEQIQAALPYVVKDSVVEQAAAQVIRTATAMFTPREWQTMVLSIRVGPLQQEEAEPDPAQLREQQHHFLHQQHQELEQQHLLQQLLCQEQQLAVQDRRLQQQQMVPPTPPRAPCRDLLASPRMHSRQCDGGYGASAIAAAAPSNGNGGADSPPTERRRRQTVPSGSPQSAGAMTEPLSNRGVLCGEPVKFTESFARSGIFPHIMDWRSSPDDAGGGAATDAAAAAQDCAEASFLDPSGHQADEGAGLRPSAQEQTNGVQEQVGLPSPEAERQDDPVRFISLDMHNECLGPFLSDAFIRCCQLYESRLDELACPQAPHV